MTLAQVILHDNSVDFAKWMISKNYPASEIESVTHLDEQTVLDLAADLGVIVPDAPVTPPT